MRDDSLFSDLPPDLRMLSTFDPSEKADLALLHNVVDKTLSQAIAEIEGLLGPLHQARLRHPVLANKTDLPSDWGVLPAVPRSESGDTVGLTGYDAEFNAAVGSSFRMVVDVGKWDGTRVVNSPGPSGNPRSPHYTDLLDTWAKGGSFPPHYSRATVEADEAQRITLRADKSET